LMLVIATDRGTIRPPGWTIASASSAMIWAARTAVLYSPDIPATDREILGEYNTAVRAAEIIADDAEAIVYRGGRIVPRSVAITNIKIGQHLTQEMIEQLDRLERTLGTGADAAELLDWKRRTAGEIALGIRQTRNYMKCGMLRDSFVSNRYGINLNVTFGMPAAQKVTSAVGWDTHATATPVTDVLTTKRAAALKGESLNRLTCSTAAFYHMVQCAEFIARIAGVVQYAVPAGAYSPQDPQMERFAIQILGLKEIVLDDATMDREEKDGTVTTVRYLPLTDVLLTSTADDGNAQAWDFANGIVTESRLAARGSASDAIGGPQRGPYGFITQPPELNPPQITFWGVQRGFPRKKRKTAGAVISTGSYTS